MKPDTTNVVRLRSPSALRVIAARHKTEPYLAKKKAWRDANKEHIKAHGRKQRLKKLYGITLEEFDAILLSQGSRCKICRTDDPGKTGYWCVDHCHNTDRVRGILCNPCNLALGYVKDTPATLKAMIRYLYDN
jgi:hypothetical protein